MTETPIADVISVTPWKIKIQVDTELIKSWETAENKLKVWSYLTISDNAWIKLIAIIENFSISLKEGKNEDWTSKEEKIYIIEAMPLWTLEDGKFTRWWNEVTIPPKGAVPSTQDEILSIYNSWIDSNNKITFSKLVQDESIEVFVDGNKFFNKHFAVVWSTWSGKSHTLAKILQTAIEAKKTGVSWINNSHIILFDIHGEYKSAFNNPNYIDVKKLILPYWLLNSEELKEFFLDTEANDHNQKNVFKEAVIISRKEKLSINPWESSSDFGKRKELLHYDSPYLFDINFVLRFAKGKNEEMVAWARWEKQWPLYWELTNFISRLENKISDKRLEFFLWEKSKTITLQDTLRQFLWYRGTNSNITIIDLSWVPFDVLAITVSLISRLLFEYGYFYKRNNSDNMDNPILLVYEEAHKYVPKNWWARFNSVRNSIERISKEWRKYWVTLGIVTQRPSEISETIFSQCSNFVSMRLTNPDDQNYVKRLLPDNLGWLVDTLSTLKSWEAILMWDALVMPSLVKINKCEILKPSSNDINYIELWQDNWKDLNFWEIEEEFKK